MVSPGSRQVIAKLKSSLALRHLLQKCEGSRAQDVAVKGNVKVTLSKLLWANVCGNTTGMGLLRSTAMDA